MQKLIGMALCLMALCRIPAYAGEVPTGWTVQNLNGVQQYIKTYTVPPETDPDELKEEPFIYDGYTYSFSGIVKEENYFADTKEASEVVTVETAKKDLASVLDALAPTMEFDDGTYQGILSLDHTSIETVASGYTTKSYTVTETKEIGDLNSNDMSYVPQTSVKNGVPVTLTGVSWQVQGTALVDDVLMPSTYKAVATYSGKATYSAAIGYITTATYVGEVSCDEVESITYTVTYVGEPTEKEQEGGSAVFFMLTEGWKYLAGMLAFAGVAGGGYFLLGRKKEQETTYEEYEDEEEEDDRR